MRVATPIEREEAQRELDDNRITSPVFYPHAGSPSVVEPPVPDFRNRGVGFGEGSQKDNVNHPGHYTFGGIECIDAIKAATTGLSGFEGFCAGAVIKYVWRWRRKGGVEDLRKATWYLDKLVDSLT